MFVCFLNKTSRRFKYVYIKMLTCRISARFHSLIEMFPDRKGPDRNGSDRNGQTESARPNRLDRNVAYSRKLLKNRER